jgi:O-antigen/teichoic acid export membrane protein
MTSDAPIPSSAPARGFRGDGIFSRAARGSTWTAMSYIGAQGLRLGSNLILTRILYPEAFGIMALVTMVLVGLTLFSDMGVAPAIMQSKRGDDPVFLNTAWTLQILRGVGLWIAACAIAFPAALFYEQPLMAQLLPVAALSLVIAGFEPTRIDTANRHLLLGRVTVLDLCATATGIVMMLIYALMTHSVWALAAGSVTGSLMRLVLMTLFLPGHRNKLGWERPAVRELTHFGIWIFLSSACGFLVSQGDKAILGKVMTIDGLGIYNIGMFLASFPLLLGQTVTSRILIPLYRERNTTGTGQERLIKMRYLLSGGLILTLGGLALTGPWLINLLYDSRYQAAGGIMVAICVVQMVQVVSLTYDQAALAAGDSRGFFWASAAKALLQTGCFLVGALWVGLPGALMGLAIGAVLFYPLIARLAIRHNARDAWHDVVFFAAAAIIAALAIWLNQDALLYLWPGSGAGLH